MSGSGWRERNRRAVQATPGASRLRVPFFGFGVVFCLVFTVLALVNGEWALAGLVGFVGLMCAVATYMVVTGLRS